MNDQQDLVSVKPLKPCAIFDLDGTLSDHTKRLKYAKVKDWDKYHESIEDDPLVKGILELLLEFKHSIVICTARPEVYREPTMRWLAKHKVPYEVLMMRPKNNFDRTWIVKLAMIRSLKQSGYNPKVIFDDDASVISMAKQLGLTTYHIQ